VAGRNKTAILAWVAAGAILAAGAIMIVIGLFTPWGSASFGWFAYQPLADATFVPGGSAVVLSRIAVVGWIVFAVGLVALAFLAGRIAGRRSRP
jgi:heme/copper-type cytochrome/quinol oxidase subunit 1